MVMFSEGHYKLRMKVKGIEGRAKEDMEEAGCGRKYDCWFEKGRCALPIKVECWH